MRLLYPLNLLHQKWLVWTKLRIRFFNSILITSESAHYILTVNKHKFSFFRLQFRQFLLIGFKLFFECHFRSPSWT